MLILIVILFVWGKRSMSMSMTMRMMPQSVLGRLSKKRIMRRLLRHRG
jgi:hypothetical protein